MSNEHAYDPTPVGEIEVKLLPERLAFSATEPAGDADDARNHLFRMNYQFLKTNQLAMTTPVERTMTEPTMRFYVPRDATDKALVPTPGVKVEPLHPRTVVSVGMRGGYSERRFRHGEHRLHAWLTAHPEWRATGEAYGAYWNGPMMPAPLRRMEVHIPVEPSSTPATGKDATRET